MSREDWEILVADFPDKEEPVCEIWYKDKHWADVSEEVKDHCIILLGNSRDGNYWEFAYDEAMEILREAREHIKKMRRTPEQQAEYDAMKKEQENWKPTPEETDEYERKMKEQWEKYYG